MKRIKFAIGALALLIAALIIFFVLRSDIAVLTHPKGMIARSELNLLISHILLMLIVIVPTFIFLFVTVWRHSAKKAKATSAVERSHSEVEWILWAIPAVVIAVMAVRTWNAAHELDPFQPIKSEYQPLTIQVVALDWKWLFIYPEQEIATLNFVQFPARTPIHFTLSADSSPMNSFWIPQLSGQIYSMSGMTTSLHMIADEPGVYVGRAAEINGAGYADMTFVVKSTTESDFEDWVMHVKNSSIQLTEDVYEELVKPSINNPVTLYSYAEKDLYNKIVMKYMHPTSEE